ncbi:uncharacterized protein F58A4.6 [Topomyia yanbarensis]|uniref:uncharacterized protein F58A4.6 n=1 Tax=Topomyia yanbarensis TaxID=2498891 RepID=UPI00273BE2CA|nr:uncharacterized protein F58A4.6 [Topomyia yanbarensis]
MISFYVFDYADSVDRFFICRNCLKNRKIVQNTESPISNRAVNTICTNSIELNDFLLNLHYFPMYRLKIANAMLYYNGNDRHQTLAIKVFPPLREPIDYKWGERANRMLWERIELDEMMSWLSTLGGAFSALGDYKLACADIAGKISMQQMKLAMRLGEPSLIARCRLFTAIAMTQKYNFAGAKQIVQQVYRAEKRKSELDQRLMKMCLGIWSKLSYEYDLYQKRLNRPKK